MTALVKLLHIVFKQSAKQITIKSDMITEVTQILVHAFKIEICQSFLNRQVIIRFIKEYLNSILLLNDKISMSRILTILVAPRRRVCKKRTIYTCRFLNCLTNFPG